MSTNGPTPAKRQCRQGAASRPLLLELAMLLGYAFLGYALFGLPGAFGAVVVLTLIFLIDPI